MFSIKEEADMDRDKGFNLTELLIVLLIIAIPPLYFIFLIKEVEVPLKGILTFSIFYQKGGGEVRDEHQRIYLN
jgi:prepilin-type N-terminal cleavage/methylation domain-containing protein